MLAIIAIFIIASMIASVLFIAATMLSSRLNHAEDHCLTEEYEVGQSRLGVLAGEASQSSP